jgi:hypothetical protein
LRELVDHLEADEELDIQTAGVTKKLGRTDVVDQTAAPVACNSR